MLRQGKDIDLDLGLELVKSLIDLSLDAGFCFRVSGDLE